MALQELPEQHAAEDEVVRNALNSIWNAYGGDEIADDTHGIVCKTAACGLDQGIITCVESWDEHGVFARNLWSQDKGEMGRAGAIIAAVRRVVDQGVSDGILKEVPNSTRYSLGVTFVRHREL